MHPEDFFGEPNESPLEDLLEDRISLYLSPHVGSFTRQVEVPTLCDIYRVDFLVRLGSGRQIALECDGRGYHNVERDQWRDALILGSRAVDAIYRMSGSSLYYHAEHCFYVLGQCEPGLFSESAQRSLAKIAHPDLQSRPWKLDPGKELVFRRQQNNRQFSLRVRRNEIDWQAAEGELLNRYQFARTLVRERGRVSIKTVSRAFAQDRP